MRLFTLFILICAGLFIGFIPMAALSFASGHGIAGLMNPDVMMGDNMNITRIFLLINHLSMFIAPAIVWGFIYYKKDFFKGLDLTKNVKYVYIAMGILFLMAAYPIVAKSYELNRLANLPGWMASAEEQTAELMKKLLKMDTLRSLLLNLIVIAIIPGIGEELIFRGILQKELGRYFKNPYTAILIASILFSAFHLQFEGFLPRMFLGIILGLVYYWSGSLWVPMIVHAFNNGLQVLMTYYNPAMATEDLESTMPVEWYYLLGSIIFSVLIGYWLIKKKKSDSIDQDMHNTITSEPTLS